MKVRRLTSLVALVVGVFAWTIPASEVSAAAAPMLIVADVGIGDPGTTVRLPLQNGSAATEFVVDWDVNNGNPDCAAQTITVTGGVDTLVARDVSCTYAAGTRLVTISITPTGANTISRFGWNESITGASKFLRVTQWGDLGLTSLSGAFWGMVNFVDVPNSFPATVTNLSAAFLGATSFDDADIGSWNTGGVTDMSAMFAGATTFNRDISNWNTSGVLNMGVMFQNASSFDQDIGNWNTAQVTNMSYMFDHALAFNKNIGPWNTSSVTTMNSMFSNARAFNQNLSNWRTSNVTDMAHMFADAVAFNSALTGSATNWNTSNVINMTSMFAMATSFNQSLNTWGSRLGSLTHATNMFRGATSFNNGKVNDCDGEMGWMGTTSLVDASGMFAGAAAFDQRLALYANNVTSMAEMFQDATAYNNGCYVPQIIIGPVAVQPQVLLNWVDLSFNTSNVTNFREMFDGAASFNRNVNVLSTASATTTVRMFRGATSFNNGCATGNLSCPLTFDLSAGPRSFGNLVDMQGMFNRATRFNQNVDAFDVSTVGDMRAAFYGASSFNNGCSANDPSCPVDWDTSSVTVMGETFDGATVFDQDISAWNVRQVVDMDRMFRSAAAFDQDLSGWCFDGAISHVDFAVNAGFQALTAKHPSWTTCPQGQIVFQPIFNPPSSTTTDPPSNDEVVQPPAIDAPVPDSETPAFTLPETGRDDDATAVALVLLAVAAVVLASRRLVQRTH